MELKPASRDVPRHISPIQSEDQTSDPKFMNFKIQISNTPCSKADTENYIILEYSSEDSEQKPPTNMTQQFSLNETKLTLSQRFTMVTTFTEDPIQKYSSDNAMLDCSSDDTNLGCTSKDFSLGCSSEDTSLECYTEDTSLGCSTEDTSLGCPSEDSSLDCSSDGTSLDYSSDDTVQDYSLDDRMQDNSSSNIILSNSPYQSDEQDSNYPSDLEIVIVNPEAVATYVASIYTAACNNALNTIDKSRINEQNSAGETPLMIAVREQNPTAVTMLTRHGADLEISKDPNGKFTALSLAGAKEYVDAVKTLVGLGARVDCMESGTILNIARENGFLEDIVYLENEFQRHEGLESSALYLAVEEGDLETVQALVKCGADLDKLDKFGQTVLQRAINSQHTDIAECLIHAGVYLDSKDVDGQTALTQACLNVFEGQTFVSAFDLDDVENDNGKHVKLIRLLLEKGADPNIKDTRGRSLLFRSLEENHLNLANVLIEGNADVNIANEVGETPLNIAVNRNDTDMIKNLLRKGADVNLYGGKFLPNPIRVAETGNVELMKLFLQHKADVDVKINRVNALFISIEKSDTNMWELLVGNGAGLEAFNARGETALMMAVKAGNIDLLRHLVQHGADVDCLNSRRVSALYEAVILGSCETVQLLVEAGAALDIVYFNDGSILHLAFRKQRKDIAELIVRTKLNLVNTREEIDKSRTSDTDEFDFINVVNRRMQTALHIAASIGSSYLVNLLTDAGADVNMTDDNNRTALQIGLHLRNIDMVEILLEAGADPNVLDEHGDTPLLHVVTYNPGFPLIRLLVQYNSNVNLQNKHGQTPLMLAVVQGKIEIINLLLDHGAKVVQKYNLGLAAVQHAIFDRSMIRLGSLIRAGADISARNSRGETYLIQSVKRLELEMVDLLIKSGANVNAQDSEGKTALMYNTVTHHPWFDRIGELLLSAGANVNIQDNNGETHLIQMVKSLRIDTVDLLIPFGADVNVQDNDGKTALMHNTATYSPYCSMIEELLLKANVNMQDRNGETHLIQMVKLSQPSIVDLLIFSGADVNVQDNDGKTALMHNAANLFPYCSMIEELLLVASDNVNIQDNNGETHLIQMVKLSRIETVDLLIKRGANVNLQDNVGKTALIHNAETHSTSFSRIEELLLAAGASVNLQDKKGKTALMYTAKYEMFHTSSQLHTAENININIEDNNHRTALYYAFTNKRSTLYELFITNTNAKKFNAEILLNLKINPVLKVDQPVFEKILQQSGLLAENISDFNPAERIRLCVSNGYMYKHQKYHTLFSMALKCDEEDVIKYLISNCYLTKTDLQEIRDYHRSPGSDNEEVKLAACKPWPLVKLAFITVSTHMGFGANRARRIKSLELPLVLQDALMFKTPIARLAERKWSEIPICLDPVKYEQLESPRPLLTFWPFGCYLRL
ncbi:serine/threonine-protein phosphatase 6 regulatory ankyrin repeat subunit A-like [Physella acuta]|uniref:serine/threonine-protein phosphatase 6 regulatory ankyrin repeat subunit A-like n=1 Tax=Physella acuta TaxID=109671 RepID=UPI0027DB9D9B|nr:serine/threonine-protein phosphatase 6 regulatory ankyrin repeat subunit A-like [Physella acuta]